MACLVHIIVVLCTISSGSADLKTALVCSIAEGAKATSDMGRLIGQSGIKTSELQYFEMFSERLGSNDLSSLWQRNKGCGLYRTPSRRGDREDPTSLRVMA